MAHTYCINYIHLIFSTKERRKMISKEERAELWAYIAGIAKNHDIAVRSVGGAEDHTHILLNLPAKLSLAEAARVLKANSSRWMNISMNHPRAFTSGKLS